MFKVREFRSEDADEVSRLARVAWDHTYREIYPQSYIADFMDRFYSPSALQKTLPATQRGDSQFQVAIDSAGSIVGFCHVGRDKNGDMELYRIYLHPDVIGRGIGTLLLKRGETFIIQAGVNCYHCYVHRLNDLGRSFYQRRGFVRVSERDSNDEWYLQKSVP